MSKSGLDLTRARVLVTNDDGVAAPGELGRGVEPNKACGAREQEH